MRDRILKNWRLAKGPEKKERIAVALDRFIAEISTPTSTPKSYTPPPDGTAAPLVNEVVQRRKENRISTDDFRSELRAIAQRCGFKIFKRLNIGQLREDWYATTTDNVGLEVESGYKEYDLVAWLKQQDLRD